MGGKLSDLIDEKFYEEFMQVDGSNQSADQNSQKNSLPLEDFLT